MKDKSESGVDFTVVVSTPSTVWCKATKRSSSFPSIAVLKQGGGVFVKRKEAIHLDQLDSHTHYMLTCYAESSEGVGMEESLEETTIEFKTKGEACIFIII